MSREGSESKHNHASYARQTLHEERLLAWAGVWRRSNRRDRYPQQPAGVDGAGAMWQQESAVTGESTVI